MAKKKISLFECQHCGTQVSKWLGKCPDCGGWDSFIELSSSQQEVLEQTKKIVSTKIKATAITDVKQDNIIRFFIL